ncbi:MAG: GNAT family N-acetyltransferase [Oscillospiraceae bacterium]|nr:GNAT family N-acetyltransferase [Oscillospiraceae bacterium]MBQ8624533.1 GNAT family N-acetyltransferase [Oscillospiraceae bacterium]
MTIRYAQTKDIPMLMELLRQVHGVHYDIRPDIFKPTTTKYSAKELEEILCDPIRPILVAADDNDNVLGYAFCVFKQAVGDLLLTDIKSLYIDDLCIDENHRGEHIGSALYEAVLALAKKTDCYNVTLNVWCGNDSAMEFYKAKGLKPQRIFMEHILEEEK